MNKKVLVIGGAGYVGSHTVLTLQKDGYAPWVLDDFSYGKRENLLPGVPVIEGSFLDLKLLNAVFTEHKFHAVLHVAALKAAGLSMLEPERYAEHNIEGSIDLLNLVLKHNPKALFIFSSSAAVYGEPVFLPITEEHPKNPINFYGYTKLAVEEILAWYGKLKGLRSISLRYFNVAGHDLSLTLKGIEKDPQNVLPILFETVFGLRPGFKIFGSDYPTPDGTARRDYVHVEDIAKAHSLAIQALENNAPSKAYNLSSGKPFSVQELVDGVKKVSGVDFKVEKVPRREGDPAELYAKASLAEKELGWKAKSSDLPTIIQSQYEIYKFHYGQNKR